jgi:ribosomal peptide maturation radical SAM protein 1
VRDSVPTAVHDVLLVVMPFGPLLQPSLGLSLLKAGLAETDATARIEYLTLPFADLVGADFYQWVAAEVPSEWVLGDWIFAGALYGGAEPGGYFEEVLREVEPERLAEISAARRLAGPFIESCLGRVRQAAARIVGFTNAFAQQTASLALARRIKEEAPETFILFGGANCEGVMGREILRGFPFVDAVVSGEGDRVFPRLVDRVLAGEPCGDLPGVHTRESLAGEDGEVPGNAPTVLEMDGLPVPDYGDFFAQWEASEVRRAKSPVVLFESSRGCWWGAAKHCTFCGLNGSTMTYRSKSPERAFRELAALAERHPDRFILVVDNILDLRYFDSLIPELARAPRRLDLFYALKANLRKDQLRALRDAGITRIQPGIESLSDDVLRRMRKGETALQNLQLLKWCKELGLQAAWNLIWGFPGESIAEYGRMQELLPLLTHLTPPQTAKSIRLDRFSPNFELGPELGFEAIPPEALQNLAYHFDFRYADGRDVDAYTAPLAREIERWRQVHGESALVAADRGTELWIWDLRPAAVQALTVLTGVERGVVLACDGIRGLRRLAGEIEVPAGEIEERVQPLLDRGLMIRQGDLLLSLAVPAQP